MLIYNNDGTLAGACGNGTRCVADRLCRELGVGAVKIETEAGVIACERLGPWSYRVDMGAPRLDWDAIPLQHAVPDTRRVSLWPDGEAPAELGPASVVNMGNPHAVFFVPDLKRIDAADLGPRIEVDPMFPEKANVTFAADPCPRRREGAGVGARRRTDARLRLGRLRDLGRGGAPWAHGAQRNGASAGRRPHHRVARLGRPCADDRPGRIRGRVHSRRGLFEAAAP